MLVCHCRKVFDKEIRACAREARSLGGVCRRSGAGTCCGGCLPLIRDLVVDETRTDSTSAEGATTGSGVAALCR
jgi:bacterioferritin-associated ferredoxin